MKGKTFLPLLCIVGLIMGIALYAGIGFDEKVKEDTLVLRIALKDERVKALLERYPEHEIVGVSEAYIETFYFEEGKKIYVKGDYPELDVMLDETYGIAFSASVDVEKRKVIAIWRTP